MKLPFLFRYFPDVAAQPLHPVTCSSFSRLYRSAPFGNEERQESRDRCWAPGCRQTRSRKNRRHRSAAPARSFCWAAGPLWREIISKLLQQADACQKMLSVKVRALGCSLVPPPCLCCTAAFFIFSPLSAFPVPITACFSLLFRGFSVIFSTSAHLSRSSVFSRIPAGTEDKLEFLSFRSTDLWQPERSSS